MVVSHLLKLKSAFVLSLIGGEEDRLPREVEPCVCVCVCFWLKRGCEIRARSHAPHWGCGALPRPCRVGHHRSITCFP